jgi:hypothetical protein
MQLTRNKRVKTYEALCILFATAYRLLPPHPVARQSAPVEGSLCLHLLPGVAAPVLEMAVLERLVEPRSTQNSEVLALRASYYCLSCLVVNWNLLELQALCFYRLSGQDSSAIGSQMEACLRPKIAASLQWTVAVEMERAEDGL